MGMIYGTKKIVDNDVGTDPTCIEKYTDNKFIITYSNDEEFPNSYSSCKIGTLNGEEITLGTKYSFSSSDSGYFSVKFLSENKFIIYNRSSFSSAYLIVGTINGSEITYGTATSISPTDMYSTETDIDVLDSTHVVIYKLDNVNDNIQQIAIATIDGTSISIGSYYNIISDSGVTSFTFYSNSIVTLDSTHFVIFFNDMQNGYIGKAVVGTVSNGDEISFGTVVTFNNAETQSIFAKKMFDNKIILGYKDSGGDNHGHCVIVTIDGTSISFGSEYTFTTEYLYSLKIDRVDDSNFLLIYRRTRDDIKSCVMLGRINDSTISYGNESIFYDDNGNKINGAILNNYKFVLSYSDNDYGYALYGNNVIGPFPTFFRS